MGRKCRRIVGLVVSGLLSALLSVAHAQGDNAEEQSYPDGAYAYAIGDFEASRILFGKECRNGDSTSCLRAADGYRIGRGGPQDYDLAVEYADIACRAGVADGCTVSATIHFEGRATGEPNYEAARAAYAAACELSDPRGCAGLGNMQYIGLGGLRERREGAENLRRACRQDFEYACDQLSGYGQNR